MLSYGLPGIPFLPAGFANLVLGLLRVPESRWPRRRKFAGSFARLVPPRVYGCGVCASIFNEEQAVKARYSEYPAWPLEGEAGLAKKTCLQYTPGILFLHTP